MRNDKERKEMVKRVQAAHKKWPTFAVLGEAKSKGSGSVAVRGDPHDEANYVQALYEACKEGTPIGRSGNNIIVDE